MMAWRGPRIVLGRLSDGQTAGADGPMAHEGVPGDLQTVREEHTSCSWRPRWTQVQQCVAWGSDPSEGCTVYCV
jgi:hypothetical protein